MTKLLDAFEFKSKSLIDDVKDYEAFKDKKLLDSLREKIISSLIDKEKRSDQSLSSFINEEIDRFVDGIDLSVLQRNHLYNLIEDELNGYGPLTSLLKDKDVTEIMVNGPSDIYIEIEGQLIKDNSVSFINDDHIMSTIERLIGSVGRVIDASNPMVDARLSDGSRFNAIIPPLSKSPIITIRKFSGEMDNIDDMIRTGSITPYMARFLEACVIAKLNIVVSGGSSSGKTSLLNVLSSFINENERIVTIEDAAELKLKQEHVITLETRKVNYGAKGDVSIRDLVLNALRMRPDRIIVGEVRGGEAFDMLQAMNTGHEGSMSTLHANSPVEALNRLETMVLMSNLDIPINSVREYITGAIDIVIQLGRLSDGRRKITSISEVIGLREGNIVLNEVFSFVQDGLTSGGLVNGSYNLNNVNSLSYKKIKNKGISSIDDIFNS